jgi:hypothetical protein
MQTDPPSPGESPASREEMAEALAKASPLLGASICLGCADSRVILSGKGSVFLLCQSEAVPEGWPKYPRQPLPRCPFLRARIGNPPSTS